MSTPSPALKADALYFGDNGRCFCGKLRCAGMSSHFSGRDLSGHRVEKITPNILRECRSIDFEPACEGCGHTLESTR